MKLITHPLSDSIGLIIALFTFGLVGVYYGVLGRRSLFRREYCGLMFFALVQFVAMILIRSAGAFWQVSFLVLAIVGSLSLRKEVKSKAKELKGFGASEGGG